MQLIPSLIAKSNTNKIKVIFTISVTFEWIQLKESEIVSSPKALFISVTIWARQSLTFSRFFSKRCSRITSLNVNWIRTESKTKYQLTFMQQVLSPNCSNQVILADFEKFRWRIRILGVIWMNVFGIRRLNQFVQS